MNPSLDDKIDSAAAKARDPHTKKECGQYMPARKQAHKDNEATSEILTEERKKRKSLGRRNQYMFRLTDAESVQLRRRIERSGLSQGDYLRSAALNGRIVIEERSMTDIAAIDELTMIRAELGRQGGMLKMILRPNEAQRQLASEEWDELIQMIRDMETIKRKLADLEEHLSWQL